MSMWVLLIRFNQMLSFFWEFRLGRLFGFNEIFSRGWNSDFLHSIKSFVSVCEQIQMLLVWYYGSWTFFMELQHQRHLSITYILPELHFLLFYIKKQKKHNLSTYVCSKSNTYIKKTKKVFPSSVSLPNLNGKSSFISKYLKDTL